MTANMLLFEVLTVSSDYCSLLLCSVCGKLAGQQTFLKDVVLCAEYSVHMPTARILK